MCVWLLCWVGMYVCMCVCVRARCTCLSVFVVVSLPFAVCLFSLVSGLCARVYLCVSPLYRYPVQRVLVVVVVG
jgi:hypothetical protein